MLQYYNHNDTQGADGHGAGMQVAWANCVISLALNVN